MFFDGEMGFFTKDGIEVTHQKNSLIKLFFQNSTKNVLNLFTVFHKRSKQLNYLRRRARRKRRTLAACRPLCASTRSARSGWCLSDECDLDA